MVKGHAVKKVLNLQYLQCSPLGPVQNRQTTLTSSTGRGTAAEEGAAGLGTTLTPKWGPLPF